MLTRPLHAQLFADASFPAEPRLASLDLAHGAVLPDTSLTLPPLQGRNIDEHFHTICRGALPLARQRLCGCTTNTPAETRRTLHNGGGSFHDGVENLDEGEWAVCFDMETMPNESTLL